ncbi:hypothetical protein DL98DRAFT_284650, partial [Cadophora sp. DSE1049]
SSFFLALCAHRTAHLAYSIKGIGSASDFGDSNFAFGLCANRQVTSNPPTGHNHNSTTPRSSLVAAFTSIHELAIPHHFSLVHVLIRSWHEAFSQHIPSR